MLAQPVGLESEGANDMGYSMVGLSNEAFVEEWCKRWCKGKAQSFVARGEEPLSKIVKTLNTAVKRGMVSHSFLQALLKEVEDESVRPFANLADYGTRLNRLDELKNKLGF